MLRNVVAYGLPTLAAVALLAYVQADSGAGAAPKTYVEAFLSRCEPVHNPHDGEVCQEIIDAKSSFKVARAREADLGSNISAIEAALPVLADRAAQMQGILDGALSPTKAGKALAELEQVQAKQAALAERLVALDQEIILAHADTKQTETRLAHLMRGIGAA